jgi:hypothetical protein
MLGFLRPLSCGQDFFVTRDNTKAGVYRFLRSFVANKPRRTLARPMADLQVGSKRPEGHPGAV